MEALVNLYSSKIIQGTDEFEMFRTFFNSDRKFIEQWIDLHMEKQYSKSNIKAEELKVQGNKLYAKKKFKESIQAYTKALCNAECNTETYSVLLANRSAVFYMMNDFKNCLKDITYCENSNCPESILLKLYIRKIKCYAKLGLKKELNDTVIEALEFVEKSSNIEEKDKVRKDILTSSMEDPQKTELKCESVEELPKLKEGDNNTFLYASSAIRIDYDEHNGRHVRSNKRLKPGDVLFIEKSLVFAPVFINENMDLILNKCYNCLSTILSCIPCKYCIRCVFCNEECRDKCWNQFHKWECAGMQTGLWYNVGIAFPAFRALIVGVKSGFHTLNSDSKADTVTFGNKCDNYTYFNKLVSNISMMKNVSPLVIYAMVVILYLKNKTEFFNWLKEQPQFFTHSLNDLVILAGGLMIRHIAQFQCNSSAIIHKDLDSYEDIPVACGIYPSVSMMNHSCKPNITIYYSRDTVVVEAAEEIEANEEICNCYGIDYRYDDWRSRQEHLKNQYYFNCRCRVCKEHFKE